MRNQLIQIGDLKSKNMELEAKVDRLMEHCSEQKDGIGRLRKVLLEAILD